MLLVCLLALHCTSSSPQPAQLAKCGASRCSTGQECVDDGSGSGPECVLACTQQAQCPYGSYCNDALPASWCAPTTTNVVTKLPGQWGATCMPAGGELGPMCDTADGFGCYGRNPTDANAFCTIFDCVADSDCPGGWWCAAGNAGPNVTQVKRSFGPTRFVCLPRHYCAPCQSDHDCPSAADGTTQQHCMQDTQGSGFCAPQCSGNDTCPLDAVCAPQPWGVCAPAACNVDGDCPAASRAERCVSGACHVACTHDADCPAANGTAQRCSGGACRAKACASDDDCPASGAGFFQHCNAGVCAPECASAGDCEADQTCAAFSVCRPRAGTCVGDGTFCSPCRSDADCKRGFCLDAVDSTERFCSLSMPTGTLCSITTGPPKGSCPARALTANYKAVACTSSSSDFAPANQCIGEVNFAGQPVPGCWTANR